ncbi:GDSL esterase/lipase [Hordeum vulgare]|nr:GDSL esterase/lipase [Hordeum vulgare]
MLAATADGNSKFTCTDTEKKRPGCTGTCPDRCPQNCISLCPSCQTYCPDQVQPVRPSLFVFGDGLTDVGNNNYLENNEVGNPLRANHSYYGIDFPNSVATGRFSNGFNMADFIAKAMGFEMSPPAYLSLNSPIKMEAGFAGVNYASATSGIWRDIDNGLDIPLMDQVKNFADTIGQMGANRSQQELSKMLSNSLFLIAIGTSDLYLIYNINNNGGSDNKTDVPHLISSYGDSLTALYNLGARKFGIINVPTLCEPMVRHGCEGLITSLREEFNDGIMPLMAGLASNLSGLRVPTARSTGIGTRRTRQSRQPSWPHLRFSTAQPSSQCR